MYDFAKLDLEARFYNRQDWQEAAESLGYEFISEAIIKEYAKEQSSVVAERMKCSRKAILTRLKLYGVKLRPRGGANFKGANDFTKDKEIVRLYAEGFTSREIGTKLGIRYWTAHNRLVSLNIPRRSVGRRPASQLGFNTKGI